MSTEDDNDDDTDNDTTFQFFTTDQNLISGTWFPMDHIFYAPCIRNPDNPHGLIERGVVVWMEAHTNINHENGWSVSVIQGEGENKKREEFDDYPSALRRMADIIEEHHKKEEPNV